MPNPCTHIATPASIEVKIFADDIEVYHSGVWKGDEARNTHISFDLPEDTQTLAINVSDAGDGGVCDHFIFANARLLSETLESETPEADSYDTNYTDENSHTDVNSDGVVNLVDLVLVAARYGETITGNPNPNPDVDRSGKVDVNDLVLVATAIDNANSAYSAPAQPLAPTETTLLPNYPNPFNPETWIPYQLSKDSNVTITIYDTQGVIVRTLPIGFQYAGFYTNRSRAAYWDSRNEIGEPVASGMYFYQLQAGNLSLLRKMLILK